MKVGLDTHQHEAGECYTRKIAAHWEDGRNCGDHRCAEAATKYRAQVQSPHGHWVDGGLFGKRTHAEADAQKLSDRYGYPVRVLEIR